MNPDCTITACSSAEAVAVAPYLLGFHPHHSLVVLGLVGHAVDFAVRYDLPSRVTDFTEPAEVIARQGADRVILIGYGPPGLVTPMVLEVGRALRAADVTMADVLRVADGRWWSYLGGPAGGTPLAPGLAAQAVYQGMVALPDRMALVAKVSPVEGRQRAEMREATGRARARATDLAADDLQAGRGGQWMRHAGRAAVREAERAARAGRALSPDEIAWLGVLLVKSVVLDYAIDRSGPEEWRIRLWNEVVRKVQPEHAPAPACLLAYAAWQGGDGSLARVAVDRALMEEPAHRIAGMLDRLLAAGIRSHSVVRFTPPGRSEQLRGGEVRRKERRGATRREPRAPRGANGGGQKRRPTRRRSL
ncbi:DUF4192 domain-containing protein [Actinoplanes sp. KI2]|uniref:DUF4192 domain-containing protein n=1 Tax=Actinoplanes sp. KI2 TaxID=2983315 RepID=UPI0021D5D464|nr:DUF4192 domain-containing protein [Actinoplanes sp. KI2]MCU7722137.1 DUF4192 domain-containing protein [Actinoplanes sp. KI2]